MGKVFDIDVEDVQEALHQGRPVRERGPYGVLVGDEGLNFRPVVIADPVPTGRQVLSAAGVRDVVEHILFFMEQNGMLQEVGLDQTVDLRAVGAERFLVFRSDRSFRFELDERVLEWGATRISGMTLKRLAGVDLSTRTVWLEKRGGKDREIDDTELVDLTGAGVERFYTKLREITVKVNTRPHTVNTKTLTFEDVVKLYDINAVPSETRIYTVTYKRGPVENPQGTLVEGGRVHVQDGMLFNVTFTDKS